MATFQQGASVTADTEFFDSIFGMGMDVDSLRLPTAGWKLRCQPVALNPRFTTRPCNAEPFGSFKLEDFHVKLHGVFSESHGPPAKLPSLAVLENFLDAEPGTAQARDGKEAADLVMRQPCNADHPVLLSREHLAMLFGVRDFKLLDHWAARMPCSKYINTITGQPTVQGRPESVICGHGRWCPNCGYF